MDTEMEAAKENNACAQLEAEETKPKSSTAQKWIMTGAVYYCNLILGISSSFLAPALLSFSAEYEADMKTMSMVITIGRYVALASMLFFGYIFGMLNRHAVVVCLLSILSVSLIFMPYGGSLIVFAVLLSTMKAVKAGYNTAQSIWIMEIWEEKAGPFIQAQHAFYALGCIIPPEVFAHFLEKARLAQYGKEHVDHMAGVYMPSLICGLASAVGAFLMLSTFIMYGKREKKPEITEKTEESAEVSKSTPLTTKKVIVVTCASLILGGTISMEGNINNYLPTYVHYSHLNFSEADGADVFSAFEISYTVSRCLAIFVAMKVNPKVILVFNFLIVAAANVLLIATTSTGAASWLYIGSVLMGVGFSTTLPTTYSYLQSRLQFNNIIASVLLVAGQSLASVTPLIIGGYVETFADIIPWLNVGTNVIGAIAFVIILITLRGVKEKL